MARRRGEHLTHKGTVLLLAELLDVGRVLLDFFLAATLFAFSLGLFLGFECWL